MESVLLISLLLTLFVVCQQPQFCIGSILYVTPDTTDECNLVEEQNVKCNSLHYYTQNVKEFFASNTTFIFLPGIHYLESNDAIYVENVSNFTLQGYHNSSEQLEEPKIDAIIQCAGTQRTGFYFRFSKYIHLERVTILYCGLFMPREHQGHPLNRAALVFEHVINVTINQIQVNSSKGFGLYGNYVVDNVSISESVFSHNKGSQNYSGGNVQFFYQNCARSTTHQLSISKCWFLHGFDVKKAQSSYPYASGLNLLINCPNVSVYMDNITALNNSGEDGGNVAVRLKYASTKKDVGRVVLNNSFIMKGRGHRGGGLRVWSMFLPVPLINGSISLPTNRTVLKVLNTHFDGNHAKTAGGALYISHYERDHAFTVTHKLLFSNCTFTANKISAFGNGAVTEIIKHKITSHSSYFTPQFDVSFQSCNFRNNWIILDEIETAHGAIIDVFSISKINFQNCNFTNNNSTSLSAVGSHIIFSGELNFENNTAVNGGAIKFCDTSVMYIANNTNILFKGNHASFFGGAIYAQQRCLESATPCFFQPDVPDYTDIKQLNHSMNLTFHNNTAKKSGNAVYGGSIDVCYTFQHFKNSTSPPSYYLSESIFNTIFILDVENKAEISSDPIGVCLCHSSDGNCSQKQINITDVYPGKQFSVYAVPIGQRHGRAAAVIRGRLEDPKESILAPIEKSLLESNTCQEVSFSIHSNESSVSFYLEVLTTTFLEESSYYKFKPPKVTVFLQPCPWGRVMSYSSGSGECMCDQHLTKSQCSAKNQTIYRYGAMWLGNVGLLTNENDSALLVSVFCPYEYCNLNRTLVTIDTLDNQCIFNRTGVLCGACAEGLSVILGGSECRHCTNITLLLILVFALMGIVLVLVLILLNLTVTEGTINGIIFYANIIQINSGMYFPYQEVPKFVGVQVLLTLISWINLDFGIRTCFYNHMDTFAKAILQYVFPIYIWLVVLVMILLSKWYTFAQRLIGRNSVKILATLFLLSIAKLGRAVIVSLANTVLISSDENKYNVWLADGNIYYSSGKHAFLLALGVFFFLLIAIFTCLVTGIQCIQRAPNVTPFKLIIRLKPLLDSYTGPYKIGSRFWTGFLLFVRIIIHILLSLNDLNKKLPAKLSMITVACLVVLFLQCIFHGVYTRRELDALEASYTLNLGVLSAVSLLVSVRNRIVTSSVFVSIALLEFGCILIYKCYILTRRFSCVKVCFSKLSRGFERNRNRTYTVRGQYSHSSTTQSEIAITPDEFNSLGPDHKCLQIPPFASYSSPREPLLDTSNP